MAEIARRIHHALGSYFGPENFPLIKIYLHCVERKKTIFQQKVVGSLACISFKKKVAVFSLIQVNFLKQNLEYMDIRIDH